MKRAFDHCAGDYALHRPPYPDGVFDVLVEESGGDTSTNAADVGAGTGIFSRRLRDFGWRVIAIEPSDAMLNRVIDGEGPAIRCVRATAEATALAGASVALVSAAQAFHWFNPPYALAEFARILRPGGVLALCWNNRDPARSDFVAAYEGLIARYNTKYDREYRRQDWSAKIAASGAFLPAARHRIDHLWTLSADGLVGFSRSVSYIRNVLAREALPRFEEELRALVREHFGDGHCHLPLRTDLWTARRR